MYYYLRTGKNWAPQVIIDKPSDATKRASKNML